MKVKIMAIGKPKQKFIQEGVKCYLKRILPRLPIEIEYLADAKGNDRVRGINQEAGYILNGVKERDFLVVLDEQGLQLDSVSFSREFYKYLGSTAGRVVFIIGGAFGLADRIRERSDKLLSLSEMTLPHEFCLLFLMEQLYRAVLINEGSQYHH